VVDGLYEGGRGVRLRRRQQSNEHLRARGDADEQRESPVAKTFDVFQKIPDAVDAESRPQAAEAARFDAKPLPGFRPLNVQAAPQRLVDDVAECAAGTSRHRSSWRTSEPVVNRR